MTMAMLCSNASNMRLVKHRKLQAVSHENRRVPSQCYPAFEIRPKKRTNIKPGLALRGYPSLKSNITIGKSPIFNKKYVDSIHAGFSSPVFRWFVGTVRDLPCWIPPPLLGPARMMFCKDLLQKLGEIITFQRQGNQTSTPKPEPSSFQFGVRRPVTTGSILVPKNWKVRTLLFTGGHYIKHTQTLHFYKGIPSKLP